MSKLQQLEPKIIWHYFDEILQIPRPSKHEEKMIAYIKNFAESAALKYHVDKVGNVIIQKPATPGMENRKTVILQSHMDMVPQKERDSTHNFKTDPIQAYIDGEWVKANKTTLGADNGIGIAAVLAVLKSNNLVHGPIEALFTVDEETGMTGAFGLEPNILHGDILLNLDSEDEGYFYIGCAGMSDTKIEFTYMEQPVPQHSAALMITTDGLKGGHSGIDINKNRGNAAKIMAMILWNLNKKYNNLSLAAIEAGTPVHNAIPRHASATIITSKENINVMATDIANMAKEIAVIYQTTDPKLHITTEPAKTPTTLIDNKIKNDLINALYACPHGVIRMDDNIPNFVSTSSNLAYVKSENGKIDIFTSQRSNNEFEQNEIVNTVKNIFELVNAKVIKAGCYPGALPDVNAPIVQLTKDIYKKLFNKEPEVAAIHAGLEFGILRRNYPHLEIISFGPTILHAHSPDERIKIATVDPFWKLLTELLKVIPKN